MLPVLRHVLRYLNVGSTQKKKVLAQMQGNDQNLFILAGGVAEVSLFARELENTSVVKSMTDSSFHTHKTNNIDLLIPPTKSS